MTPSPRLDEERSEHYIGVSQINTHGYSRPRRESRLQTRFNDFVMNNKQKYSIHRSVNYVFLNDENKCLLSNLNKTIDPRKWSERLCSSLFDFGFKQRLNDYSLFVYSNDKSVVVLLMYVDDIILLIYIILTCNNISEIENVKAFLKTWFLIKDLGKVKYFIGIEVIDINNEICLIQSNYCLGLLHVFGMLACKLVRIPLETNFVVKRDCCDKFLQNVTEFQKLIGKLIYFKITRLVIAYVVQTLSLFMHGPHKSRIDIMFMLLKVLKHNSGKEVKILKSDMLNLKGYLDGDWAKCLISRRSVTGFMVYLGGSLISWKSKKQDTVSRLSTKAEYRALEIKQLTPVNICLL